MGGMTRVKATAERAANVTALSHPGPTISLVLPGFCRLARRSLGVGLTMLVSSGCIVAEPPTLDGPQKTPPFLILSQAVPPTTALNKVRSEEEIALSVPVRAEDSGDQLVGTLFVDFGSSRERQDRTALLAPSTFDEEREMSITWLVPTGLTCRQVTLVVTHFSNLDGGRPIDTSDVALATWWFEVEVPGRPFTSIDCPTPLGTPQ